MQIGFIGIGNQGGPIAERILAAGFALRLWARRPEALTPFCAAGGSAAENPEALGRIVDVLCICVLDDAGVTEIFDRAVPQMAPGGLVVVLSTAQPATCRMLAAKAALRDIALIDAPVSGGGDAARTGRLTVMAGGAEAAYARALPLLQSFATTVVHLGDVGCGQQAKLVNNALMAANLALALAAVEAGTALGIDPAALNQILAVSSGQSFAHSVLARLPGLDAFGTGAKLLRKDIGLMRDLTESAGIDATRLLEAGGTFIRRVEAALQKTAGT